MNISKHAKDRLKERCGIPKKAIERKVKIALEKGLKHKETSGSLRKYVSALYCKEKDGTNITLHDDMVYIFTKTTLITVFHLPNKYKNLLKKQLERKTKNMKTI